MGARRSAEAPLSQLEAGSARALEELATARRAMIEGLRALPDLSPQVVATTIGRLGAFRGERPVPLKLEPGVLASLGPANSLWVAGGEAVAAAHQQWMDAFEARLTHDIEHLQEWLADARVQEAIFLSSPRFAELLFSGGSPEAPEGSALPLSPNRSNRKYLAVATRYLQRLAAKCDTISFFGPYALGEWGKPGPAVTLVQSDAQQRRRVLLTLWANQALGRRAIAISALLADAHLGRHPLVHFDGAALHPPLAAPRPLPAPYDALLREVDGQASGAQVVARARALDSTIESEEDGLSMLAELIEQGAVIHDLLPGLFDPDAGHTLREKVAQTRPTAARTAALAVLDEVEVLRSDLERSAWPRRREPAARLDLRFEELTGEAPERNLGTMYGSRQIYFEDALSARHLALGPALTAQLEAHLAPLLDLCRACTRQAAHEREAIIDEEWRSKFGRKTMPLVDYLSSFVGTDQSTLTELSEQAFEIENRWNRTLCDSVLRALKLDPSERSRHQVSLEDFSAAVAASLPPSPPVTGFPLMDVVAPDLMLAAANLEALQRGEFQIVVGEIHRCANTIANVLAKSLLAPAVLDDLVAFTTPSEPFLYAGSTAGTINRASTLLPDLPHVLILDRSCDPSGMTHATHLPIADFLVVDEGGKPIVCSRDGKHRAPLFSVIGPAHSGHPAMLTRLSFLRGSHGPRLTVGKLVIERETWKFAAGEFGEMQALKEIDALRFHHAARFRQRHGLPRFVFAKSNLELKPVMVDFESPLSLMAMGKLAAQADRLTLSEMLPGPTETWLPGNGGKLVCELRLLARPRAI